MRFLYIISLLMGFAMQANAAGVAVIAPKDGDEAKFGLQLIDGVKIAVDEINSDGGLLGEKLELISLDDVCSETSQGGEKQRLFMGKDSGINLVVGPYCQKSGNLNIDRAAVQIFPQPMSQKNFVADSTGVLKIGGWEKDQADTLWEVYKERWADKNIAAVYDGNDSALVEVAEYLQQIFINNGMQGRINLYDFATYKKLKSMAKEIVKNNKIAYILGNKSQIAKLAQKLQEKNEDIILITDEYHANGHFFKEMGNFADGTYWLRLDDQKANAEFTDKLVDLRIKGHEPKGMGIMGYAAVMLWRDMVKKAQTFALKEIDKIAKSQKWNLPWGEVQFNHGNISKSSGWNMYRFEDGEYTQVN